MEDEKETKIVYRYGEVIGFCEMEVPSDFELEPPFTDIKPNENLLRPKFNEKKQRWEEAPEAKIDPGGSINNLPNLPEIENDDIKEELEKEKAMRREMEKRLAELERKILG